ncbi:cytochrome c oxidase subunit 3 [Dyadobacter pollutisoli]|uniref:Cytochrome c oxidase subunit 3 n=1 Tax=Dyadobacter pollutisoli TaxID=2910158 RepID=A0A9E8NA60_9BACT|nr:cytochrome c oxidase subunit 3 [Dyadobacter pollutisoli]WAC10644.1 cytochrome c oxidase subunit 3 [Dyadobacter pollutisoli]
MAANVTTPGAVEPKMWMGGIEPMKASYGKLMMWFFLISDTFTFSALLVAYGTARFSFPAFTGKHADFTFSNMYWPVPERVYESVPFLHGVSLPLVFVGIMTFILIASSVTMVLAVEAGHRLDRANVEKYMLWTILGGFTFLGCQAWEWSHFIHGTDAGSVMKVIENGTWIEKTIFGANLTENQYGPPAFADFFFFITGFHGTHVFSGVILNILIFFRSATGFYDKRGSYEMVEKVGLYWHFVDLVWVFVFTFFYLV